MRAFLIATLLATYIRSDVEHSADQYHSYLKSNLDWLDLESIDLATPPFPGQKSIDQAMFLFSIKVSRSTLWPVYLENLDSKSRALTIQKSALDTKIVVVGEEAFSSWGMLGSTLAHEVEIHGNQNLLWLSLRDRYFDRSVASAEVEAYNYEIYSQARFGLSKEEINDLHILREEYLEILNNDSKKVLK